MPSALISLSSHVATTPSAPRTTGTGLITYITDSTPILTVQETIRRKMIMSTLQCYVLCLKNGVMSVDVDIPWYIESYRSNVASRTH